MTDKMDLEENGSSESALREAAEVELSKSPDASTKLKKRSPEEIIHELQVHQVELEMQNDELKRVQLALEASRDKYQDDYRDLYDLAPVGYFTLTNRGLITQANLTGAALLGMPFPELIKRGFGYFVTPESLDDWDHHIINVFGHEKKQTCDLLLKRKDGSTFYACLESIRVHVSTGQQRKNNGGHEIRMAVIDITDRRRMEEAKKTLGQFFSFFSNLYAGVLVATTDGRVEFVNQAFCDLFNLHDPPENLLGLGSAEMIQKIAPAYADPTLTVSRIQDIVAKLEFEKSKCAKALLVET